MSTFTKTTAQPRYLVEYRITTAAGNHAVATRPFDDFASAHNYRLELDRNPRVQWHLIWAFVEEGDQVPAVPRGNDDRWTFAGTSPHNRRAES